MIEGGVESGAGVSLGEDDAVVAEVLGVFGVELKALLVEEEDCHYFCDGGGRGGVSGFGGAD